MKTMCGLFSILLALAMLTACGQPGSAPSESAAPSASASLPPASSASAVAASSSGGGSGLAGKPWEEVSQDIQIPDFLDAEQTLLYEKAAWAYPQMSVLTSGFGTSGSDSIDVDGITYYKSDGLFDKWDEFYDAMTGIFTEEYFTELNEGNEYATTYIDVDGDMYCTLGDRGGNITYLQPDSFELVSQTDDELVFNLIGHYIPDAVVQAGSDSFPQTWEGMDDFETTEYPIRFVKEKDGWRVAQFNVPY